MQSPNQFSYSLKSATSFCSEISLGKEEMLVWHRAWVSSTLTFMNMWIYNKLYKRKPLVRFIKRCSLTIYEMEKSQLKEFLNVQYKRSVSMQLPVMRLTKQIFSSSERLKFCCVSHHLSQECSEMFIFRYTSNFKVFPISLGLITSENSWHCPTKYKMNL